MKAQEKFNNVENPVIGLLVVLVVAIFMFELIIMLLLNYVLPPMTPLSESILDSLILITILFPILYTFVFRPMVHDIYERRKAERALNAAHATLEKKVMERTIELGKTNKSLKKVADAHKRNLDALEKWQKMATGRESTMIQLKKEKTVLEKEITELKEKIETL